MANDDDWRDAWIAATKRGRWSIGELFAAAERKDKHRCEAEREVFVAGVPKVRAWVKLRLETSTRNCQVGTHERHLVVIAVRVHPPGPSSWLAWQVVFDGRWVESHKRYRTARPARRPLRGVSSTSSTREVLRAALRLWKIEVEEDEADLL